MLQYYNRFFAIFDKSIEDKIGKYKNAQLIYGDQQEDDMYIYVSKDMNYAIDRNSHIIILGLVLDSLNNTLDINIILQKACQLINNDINTFYDYLDHLNGRFLIIFKYNGDFYILNDAGGTRSIWYNTKYKIVASHYYIVNLLHKEKESEIFILYTKICTERNKTGKQAPWCLPGDASPYENIKLLIPNHYINISKNMQIGRYWPRQEIPTNLNFNAIVEYISENLKKQLSLLCNKYNVISGLTCGNDSRISLAALNNILDKVTFFTYHSSETTNLTNFTVADLNKNIEFALDVAKRENLKFLDIDCTYKNDDTTEKVLESMHYHNHMRNNIAAYQKSIPKNCICLRHIFTELIRTSYFNFPDYFNDDLPSHMIRWSQYKDIDKDDFDKLYKLYSDFIKTYDYKNLFNYNPGDIFYWEYRMAQWMCGSVLTENDLAFDTFVPCNTRSIIMYGLSLPKLLKDKNVLVDEIINKLAPRFLEQYKYPNEYEHNYKLIDWFTEKSYSIFNFQKVFHYQAKNNGEYSYTVSSKKIKNDKVNIFFRPRLEGAIIGFSNSIIYRGESISLSMPYTLLAGKSYNFIFNIYCFNTVYGYNGVSYFIIVDKKIIYELDTNTFCGRINQIIYNFKSEKSETITIEIQLKAKKDLKIYYNGIIDIKNISLREENVFTNANFIDSTFHRLTKNNINMKK